MRTKLGKTTLAILVSAALASGGVMSAMPLLAYSDDTTALSSASVSDATVSASSSDSDATIDALQTEIERSGQAYDDANSRLEQLESQIADNQSRIDELEGLLPVQEDQCNEAIVTLYKYRTDNSTFLDMVFASDSFTEVMQVLDYFNELNDLNITTIANTKSMRDELETTKAQLESDKASVETEKDNASKALDAAQSAREEAQRKAEEAAAADLAAQQAAAAAAAQSANVNEGSTYSAPEAEGETPEASESVDNSTVDWSVDKTAFVAEWGPRIDDYLDGSPLSGYGDLFASSAYDSGVDPRWSPAISCVESGKGSVCFRSHNAWGWGSKSFDSWEESIPEHVAYLGRKYGGYLTLEAAAIYCPPSYESWYNSCARQMDKI